MNSPNKVKDTSDKSGFKLPENYFENFENRLFNKIESETLPKETGFKAPNRYFENLEDSVLQKLHTQEKSHKLISLNPRMTLIYLTAIAACLVIIVTTLIENESIVRQMESIKTGAIETYIDEGYLDLENDEIFALFDNEDLNNINFESDLFSEESLEDYLLENNIEETILIE
jgi:hypothetical protein